MKYEAEIARRRTFGIISHPDAGKTTLTEKLLLFGGAIQTAGAVKSNKIRKTATSDFMEIEKQRGISVDSVILVIDCANGVEEQTEKLMSVCRMRDTPVIIFVNKMDREGRDPFDLCDELEKKLDIIVRPLSWPIGIGQTFKGVYSIYDKKLNLFNANKTKIEEDVLEIENLQDPILDEAV